MPIAPNSTYAYMVPLQQAFFDKDSGELLAAGVVKFWSDENFTVPKNVYKQTQTTPFGFTPVGAVLTLSSIGTFVSGGTNFTPFLWPFVGDPASPPPSLSSEKYYIQVFNSSGVLQFTVDDWPPVVTAEATKTTTLSTIVTVYTANSTWIRNANTKIALVEVLGAGGGGGGCTSGAGNSGVGSGGGAGGYTKKMISFTGLGASQVVTIGAAGGGGAAGVAGTNGGNTSFGALLTGSGGVGGGTSNTLAQPSAAGGAGGTAAGGDITVTGQQGGFGSNNYGSVIASGYGGSSIYGGGGSNTWNTNGNNATGYGAGGGGASSQEAVNRTGGNGTGGLIIVTEYLSS